MTPLRRVPWVRLLVWLWMGLAGVLPSGAAFEGTVRGSGTGPYLSSFTLKYGLGALQNEPTYWYAFPWNLAPDSPGTPLP